jgi:selenocysteine-specific elongation factor
MIFATAGHVDHGKTSLIRALTNIDTDRLEEEKRRGMSIDLGFAYADFGLASPVGFVDVPGHERFVRNMLAGVAAIDCALLVIAADDGPMPQTREHLAILSLLGVTRAVVALTKIDRVDEARLKQADLEIRALIATTPLRDAAIFPVVATTGLGVPALREGLRAMALDFEPQESNLSDVILPESTGNFRLAVDRVFVLAGAGLVVSGAVYSGHAQVGDSLLISPKGVEARIRSIHAQNQSAQFARAGQRCALNLTGSDLKKDDVARGDWVLASNIHAPTQRLDVEFNLLANEEQSLRDGISVQLHLAATSVPARVALLNAKTLAPGAQGLAQLVLERPIAALHGDRFVVRDQSAQRTIAGGRVIDPFGPVRGRMKPARLVELDALRLNHANEALMKMLIAKPCGLDLRSFECAWNLNQREQTQIRRLPALCLLRDQGRDLALTQTHWQDWRASLSEVLANHHSANPASLGLSESGLMMALSLSRAEPPQTIKVIGRLALKSLMEDQRIVRDGLFLRLPNHKARLSEKDQVLLDKITGVLMGAGLRPPIIGELAKALGLEASNLLQELQKLSQSGHLLAVASNRYYLPSSIASLVQMARELAAQNPDLGFDAASFRDRSGIGRNSTIEVLEFLDRQGYTRFVRNRRWMRDSDHQI